MKLKGFVWESLPCLFTAAILYLKVEEAWMLINQMTAESERTESDRCKYP